MGLLAKRVSECCGPRYEVAAGRRGAGAFPWTGSLWLTLLLEQLEYAGDHQCAVCIGLPRGTNAWTIGRAGARRRVWTWVKADC